MSKKICEELIINTAANISNEIGFNNLTLKVVAKRLNIKSPSLYNHISSLEELKYKLMLYGWKKLETQMLDGSINVSGYDAMRKMCEIFYDFALTNKGVFDAMLWYNMYANEDTNNTLSNLFFRIFDILKTLGYNDDIINHFIRTYRAFLEGYALLVNNNAFGNQLSIKESFDFSLDLLIEGLMQIKDRVKGGSL